MRAQMSSIMGQIEAEHLELFALEFGKIAESDFVYTLVSTNIDQPAPNLVKMYMTIRFGMSSIMDLIRIELSELHALEFENLPYLTFVYTVASANIDQSVPNLATIYMPIKSQMSLIMGQMELEHLELFALEFGKIAESDFVYTLASTNIDQPTPNLVKMYVTIRSRMSSIMDLIGPELSEISVSYCDHSASIIVCPSIRRLAVCPSVHNLLVNTLASTNINQSSPNLVIMYMTTRARMSFIMELIGPELSEISAFEFENLPYLALFTL